jgi:hypothetical protein
MIRKCTICGNELYRIYDRLKDKCIDEYECINIDCLDKQYEEFLHKKMVEERRKKIEKICLKL